MDDKTRNIAEYQDYEKSKIETGINLLPCPWCKDNPIYVVYQGYYEVYCRNPKCLAQPQVGYLQKYTKEEVTKRWNSYKLNNRYEENNINEQSTYTSKTISIPPWETDSNIILEKKHKNARKDLADRMKKELMKC